MHQLLGIIDTEFVDYILANEQQKDPSYGKLIKEGGHDSPISEDDANREWLGRHQDMSSPGKISLHRDRLGRAFWACIHELDGKVDTQTDHALRRLLCQSMVNMVLAHERFHHFCDVIGRITGCRGGEGSNYKKDWMTEEALATAWEWQHAQRNFESMADFPVWLRDDWIKWWFGSIKSNGYKDWKRFSHSCFFKEGLSKHLTTYGANDLAVGKDHDSGDGLYAKLDALAWVDSTVTYWKATDGNENPGEQIKTETTCTATIDSSRTPKWIEVTSMFCQEDRTDLKNIHKEIDASSFLTSDLSNPEGKICLNGNPIKSHILGLLLISEQIPKIKRIGLYGLRGPLLIAVEIINKHMETGKKEILAAQGELIDAGLNDFAKL